ncbi:MAG: hypothetical protein MUE40_11740 [Anaerolineae bacterium]|nr:hypothetical protein [Anaerolineae bacterium]
MALVEREHGEVRVVAQCALLSVPRSGVYYLPRPQDERTLLIQRRIDELYTACPFYKEMNSSKFELHTGLTTLSMFADRLSESTHQFDARYQNRGYFKNSSRQWLTSEP